MSEVNRLEWEAFIRDSELMAGINRIERRVGGMVDQVGKKGREMEGLFAGMAKAATAFFTISSAQQFIQQLVRVRSEFQQLEIAFTTMLGSKEKADKLTQDLVQFASTTPFGMKDTANAAKQLLAYGSSASSVKDELRMLGDVASGVSQPIGDLVYLYGTLRTQGRAYLMDIRQFAGRGIPIYKELAKVLQVSEIQVNSFVESGKVGFAEVQKAFQNMTATGSMFGGLMEAQSKTIQGELERLGDGFDLMLNKIGKDTEGVISSTIQTAASLIENYETILNLLSGLIVTYGAYRAALIATAALHQLNAARVVGMTAVEMLHYAAIVAKTAAMKALNAVMIASPAIIMTGAILALTAAIYSLTQVTDATTASQEKLAEAHDVGAKKADDEKRSIQQLVSVLKDNTASAEQKKAAYDKLQAQTKGILASFSQEEIAVGKANATLEQYIQTIGRAASARKAFDQYNALAEQLDVINRKGIEGVGIWTRTGRALQNAFGVNGAGAAKNFWGFGKEGAQGDQYIVDQEKQSLKDQMKALEKEFGQEFKGFITGVEKVADKETPSDLFTKRLKDPINNFNSLIKTVSNKTELDSLKKAVTEKMESLSPTDPQINKYKEKLKQIAKIEESYSISKDSGINKENNIFQSSERYNSILNNIDQAKNQMLNNQLDRDQQEINSTKEKYSSLRDEVRKFNADPRNKKTVDPSKIDDIENQELDYIKAKQKNEKQLKLYQEDLESYNKYQDIKRSTDEETADRLLGKYKNVYQDIQKEIDSLEAKKANKTISLVEEAYLKSLSEMQKEHLKGVNDETLRSYLEALKMLETFGEAEVRIRKKYDDALMALGDNATEERKAILQKALKEDLAVLIENDPKFKEAIKAIDDSSQGMLTSAFINGRKVVNELIDGMQRATAEEKTALKAMFFKFFDDGIRGSMDRNFQTVESLIGGFDQVVNQALNFDKSLANSFRTIGGMLSTFGNMAKTLSSLGGSIGRAFEGLGGNLPIVGAIVGVVGSIISIFEGQAEKKRQAREKAERYAQDYQLKQIEAITKALEYQLQIVKDIYGTDRIKAYEKAIKDSEDRVKNSVSDFNKSPKYSLTGDPLLDSLINNRNAGKKNALGLDKLLDGFISKGAVKKIDLGFTEVEDITQEHLTKLYKMLEDGSLDEPTKTQVQSIIDSYKVWKDATNQLKEELLGVSFKGILDLSSELFFNSGEDAGNAFSKGFQNIMRDFVKNQFKREFLELEMQKFYDKYDELAKDGLTAEESKYLKSVWDDIEKRGKEKLENLQKDIDVDLNDKGKDETLSGKIRREISEQTGSEIVGLSRAQFEQQKLQAMLMQDSNKIQANLLTIANNKLVALNAIQVNTANTVLRLDTAVGHLAQIVKNTNGTSGRSAEGMGL